MSFEWVNKWSSSLTDIVVIIIIFPIYVCHYRRQGLYRVPRRHVGFLFPTSKNVLFVGFPTDVTHDNIAGSLLAQFNRI
jgi:hypothetical protein